MDPVAAAVYYSLGDELKDTRHVVIVVCVDESLCNSSRPRQTGSGWEVEQWAAGTSASAAREARQPHTLNELTVLLINRHLSE
jgi:hypothetical protein